MSGVSVLGVASTQHEDFSWSGVAHVWHSDVRRRSCDHNAWLLLNRTWQGAATTLGAKQVLKPLAMEPPFR